MTCELTRAEGIGLNELLDRSLHGANMKTPIEMMLDGVHWQEAPTPEQPSDGMLWATHAGVLELAGSKLRCYRLSNGQTIFDADDFHDFFGGELRSNV